MNINIGLIDACILSIFCILIVFIVLIIVSMSVNLIKILVYKQRNISKTEYKDNVREQLKERDNIKFDEIKDESMLIAAFVASIDAVDGDDNKTVRVKKINQIQ